MILCTRCVNVDERVSDYWPVGDCFRYYIFLQKIRRCTSNELARNETNRMNFLKHIFLGK